MAKYQYKNNGPSAEDRALDVFADLMIKKIESVSSNWQKPWFTKNALQWPKNLSGREYNGMNALILMFQQENKGWNSNRFATFERISSLNFDDNRKPLVDKEGNKLPFVTVTKGEKSTPVMFTSFTVVHKETHDKIKYDDYKNLPDDEKLNYSVYPKLQVYNVFNIDQTNIKEARPELYAKFNQEYEEVQHNNEKETMEIPAVDTMIKNDLYVCPIKPTQQDRAYYDSNKDTIVVPLKEQFKNGEAFYGTLFHEMSHASGAQNRLNRFASGDHFGSPSYAREELVAELTAALLSTRYGMEKNLKDDSARYLKSWLSNLKQDPSYIKTTLFDVKRSANYISTRVESIDNRLKRDGVNADFSDIREKKKKDSALFIANENKIIDKPKQEEKALVRLAVIQPGAVGVHSIFQMIQVQFVLKGRALLAVHSFRLHLHGGNGPQRAVQIFPPGQALTVRPAVAGKKCADQQVPQLDHLHFAHRFSPRRTQPARFAAMCVSILQSCCFL